MSTDEWTELGYLEWVGARTYGYHPVIQYPDTVGLRVLPVLIACRTRYCTGRSRTVRGIRVCIRRTCTLKYVYGAPVHFIGSFSSI